MSPKHGIRREFYDKCTVGEKILGYYCIHGNRFVTMRVSIDRIEDLGLTTGDELDLIAIYEGEKIIGIELKKRKIQS